MTRRREFIKLLEGVAAAGRSLARAQQPRRVTAGSAWRAALSIDV